MNLHPLSRIGALLLAVMILAGCRLDTEVLVEMDVDGTGTVTIVATADAELVERVPNLSEELRFGDAEAAGWTVDGPTATAGGGATLTLSHDFRDAREATALVQSLGGPLRDVTVRRRVTGEEGDPEATAINALEGTTVLRGGFEAFADQALVDAVGGLPFADELEGKDPARTMSITLDVALPGEVTSTNGEQDGERVRWQLPLGGREQVLELSARQETDDDGGGWAGPVATVALVALIAWLALAVAVLGYRAARRSGR